ncbi:hypothetical protein E4U16_000025 [Claviceps sp. LM84 group G4]|nr:hypothetical protein E4U16_000025 [Claviceps sp. LM84 group G4]
MDREPGTFSRFPTEIHRLIFEHCYDDDLKSVIFLGVTNRYFWSIAREYVVWDSMQSLGVWAGQQLITVGDYLREDRDNLLKRRPEDEDDEMDQDEIDELPVEDRSVSLYDRIDSSFEPEEPRAMTRFSGRDATILDALVHDS